VKVIAISANLGNYDQPAPWAEQVMATGVELAIHRLDDSTFPPRPLAMTSRLQCGIPKWFGPDLFGPADVYIWLDASVRFSHPYSAQWFLEKLDALGGPYDLALFRHPERSTIRSEIDFCTTKIRQGNRYLCSRYAGEWWGAQRRAIESDGRFDDCVLYASTAFAYRPTPEVRAVFKEVWFHKTRYCLHDQPALAYCLGKSTCKVSVIPDNYMKCKYLEFVRKRR
jgi:hypothetical protein